MTETQLYHEQKRRIAEVTNTNPNHWVQYREMFPWGRGYGFRLYDEKNNTLAYYISFDVMIDDDKIERTFHSFGSLVRTVREHWRPSDSYLFTQVTNDLVDCAAIYEPYRIEHNFPESFKW